MSVASHAASGPEAALRIEQEHAGGHNAVHVNQAGPHLDAISELNPKRHGAWVQAIAHGDEDVLLPTGIDDGIAWDGDGWRASDREGRGSVEARPQRTARVRNREAHAQRTGPFAQGRIEEVDRRRERRAA